MKLAAVFACAMLAASLAAAQETAPAQAMLDAVTAFQAPLSAEEAQAFQMPFDDEARTGWSYLPGDRKGVEVEVAAQHPVEPA